MEPSREPGAGLIVLTVISLIWHLLLVLALAFLHFGDPTQFILLGLDRPGLETLYANMVSAFVPVSLGIGIVLPLLFAAYSWILRVPKWIPVTFAVLPALFVINGLMEHETELFGTIQWTIRLQALLQITVIFLHVKTLRGRADAEFPERPILPIVLLSFGGLAAIYALRELSVEDWWIYFPQRYGLFLLTAFAIILSREAIWEPLSWLRGGSMWLRLQLIHLGRAGVLAFLLCMPLADHLVIVFPQYYSGSQGYHYFLGELLMWLVFLFLLYQNVAFRWMSRRESVFGRKFSPVDYGVLFPIAPLDRLLEKRLSPLSRFLVSYGLLAMIPFAILRIVLGGSFFLYLLSPSIAVFIIYLWACLAPPLISVIKKDWKPSQGLRIPIAISLVVLVAGWIVFAATRDTGRLRERLHAYGGMERMIQTALESFSRPEPPRQVPALRKAQDVPGKYAIEKAREPDFGGYNVLLLTSDAVRAENVSCHGYKRRTTPNIDALARRSFLFKNAVSPASHTWGTTRSFLRGDASSIPLHSYEGTWLAELQRVGVFKHTAIFNTTALHLWDMLRDAEGLEFEKGFEIKDKGLIRRKMERFGRDPFFLWAHNYSTHLFYRFRPSSTNFGSRSMDLYDNNIHYFDAFVADTLGVLKELGIADRTIVIIASDHGEYFGEHGFWGHASAPLHQEVIHIPMLVHIPGMKARVIHDYVSLMDLGLTLVELFGYDNTEELECVRSLRSPLLEGKPFDADRTIPIAAMGFNGLGILLPDGRKFFVTPETEYFYNLAKDPKERRNLVYEDEEGTRRMRDRWELFWGIRR